MKYVLSIMLAVVLPLSTAVASNRASHRVTVRVPNIDEVGLTNGDITMDLSLQAGVLTASDNSVDIEWTTNGVDRKITVQTNQTSSNYELSVTASNCTADGGGSLTALSADLSTTAAELVTGIKQDSGRCDLTYTATASLTDQAGSETHIVIYTLTGN